MSEEGAKLELHEVWNQPDNPDRYVKTGEFRRPKKGEWYVESGGRAFRAGVDYDYDSYHILTKYTPQTQETINHPPHYGGDTTYEAIKVIDAWGLGFNLGNTVKYISRAGKKDPSRLKDLKKAEWYLQREIAKEEANEASKT